MMRKLRIVHCVLLVTMMTCPLLAQSDSFYTKELNRGLTAWNEDQWNEASESLRIAAFGLLDQPPLLMRALVPLYLTYVTMGRESEAVDTLEQILAVEERFSVWAGAGLTGAQRESFLQAARRSSVAERVNAIPAFAAPAVDPRERFAELSGRARTRALEQAMREEPRNPIYPLMLTADAAARGDHDDTIRWATAVLGLEQDHAEALLYRARAHAAQRGCAQALSDFEASGVSLGASAPDTQIAWFNCLVSVGRHDDALATVGELAPSVRENARVAAMIREIAPAAEVPRDELAAPASESHEPRLAEPPAAAQEPAALLPPEETQRVLDVAASEIAAGRYGRASETLYDAVQRDPGNRALRKSLLEATTLARDFRTAAAQVPLLAPFVEGEESSAFYAAVASYETGRIADAKRFLEFARTRVSSRPWVDFYARRIEQARE